MVSSYFNNRSPIDYMPLNLQLELSTAYPMNLNEEATQLNEEINQDLSNFFDRAKSSAAKAFNDMSKLGEEDDEEEEPVKEVKDKKAKKLEKKKDGAVKDLKEKERVQEDNLEPVSKKAKKAEKKEAKKAKKADQELEVVEKGDKKEKKAKKEKEPFGKRHLAAFTAGMAFSAVMPALLENQPLIGYAMMGPYMDFIRVAYKSMPDDNWRTAFKAAAFASVFFAAGSAIFAEPDSVWNRIPWSSFAIAILLKCEFNKWDSAKILEIETLNIGEKLKSKNVTPGVIKGGVNSVVIGSSALLTAPIFPPLTQVAAGTIEKAYLRKVVNGWFSVINSETNPTTKKVATYSTYALLPVVGGLSYYALENKLASNWGVVAAVITANVVSLDTLTRLFKSFLWKFTDNLTKSNKKAEKLKKKDSEEIVSDDSQLSKLIEMAKYAPRAFLLIGLVLGVSYPINRYMTNANLPPAIAAIIAQEMATLLKPLSKGYVGTRTSLAVELPTFLVLALGLIDNQLGAALLADNIIFGLKDEVRPKKITLEKPKKKVELEFK